MIYEHPVEPPRQDSPDAVREFTQRCTDVLEMHVRRHPELWLWMHRRWRDAPGRRARRGARHVSRAADETLTKQMIVDPRSGAKRRHGRGARRRTMSASSSSRRTGWAMP